ncbi:MAG: heparan-alpha-glucosaminide N-acetyltransferase domain-containing protein [Gemmatimonadales bacterium]
MTATPTSGPSRRIAAIDLARGVVMILMAIDHVRVYSGVPAGGPSPAVFFTRWVTHFCAPVFLFLAGTSAFLYGRRHHDLSRFLITRGLWLVVLELTVLRFAWTFNVDFAGYEMAGVIWVIGWCMVLMAALVRLPVRWVGAIGVAIMAGHNLLDFAMPALGRQLAAGPWSGLWKILYLGFVPGPISFGEQGPNLIVLYSVVPWIGVMAAGYGFGLLLDGETAARDRRLRWLGVGMIVLFLLLRGSNLYGDPRPWSSAGPMPGVLSFLGTTKYPASFLFLLMTLGPMIAVFPWLDRRRGRLADAVTVFGRVPFFYYVLHIPLIHALALVVSRVREGAVNPWLFANHPMGNPPPPDGYVWSLGLLYLVFAVAIGLLYPACRWFAGVKQRRKDWWLSYL